MTSSYWSDPEKHAWDGIWMNHPAVRAWVNRRVTGDPSLWPIHSMRLAIPKRLPFGRALSLGSGLGNFERALVQLGIATTVTGVDLSPEILTEAERRAAAEGLADRIQYVAADARAFLGEARDLDAVCFHASLHHFDRVGELLDLVLDALKPGGVLYLDEYIGPSRHEWTWRHVLEWNVLYRSLPAAVRRTHIIRPPVSDLDPTEAVAASDILPEVARRFRILHRWDYGGNLFLAIYPSLLRPDQPGGPPPPVYDRAIGKLLSAEETLLARGRPSFHAVMVAVRP